MRLQSILLLLLLTSSLNAKTFNAEAFSIIDGDTLKVRIESGEIKKIRLAEIDCPEKKQPWGIEATKALTSLSEDQLLSIKQLGIDRYGRIIATLFKDKTNINWLLVEQGHCWVYPKYVKDKAIFALQEKVKLK